MAREAASSRQHPLPVHVLLANPPGIPTPFQVQAVYDLLEPPIFIFLLDKMLKTFGIKLHEYRLDAATLEAGFQQAPVVDPPAKKSARGAPLSPDSGLAPLGIGMSSEATSGIGISSLTVNSQRYSQEPLVQNAEHRLSDSGRVSSGLGMSSLTGPSKYNEEVGIAEHSSIGSFGQLPHDSITAYMAKG